MPIKKVALGCDYFEAKKGLLEVDVEDAPFLTISNEYTAESGEKNTIRQRLYRMKIISDNQICNQCDSYIKDVNNKGAYFADIFHKPIFFLEHENQSESKTAEMLIDSCNYLELFNYSDVTLDKEITERELLMCQCNSNVKENKTDCSCKKYQYYQYPLFQLSIEINSPNAPHIIRFRIRGYKTYNGFYPFIVEQSVLLNTLNNTCMFEDAIKHMIQKKIPPPYSMLCSFYHIGYNGLISILEKHVMTSQSMTFENVTFTNVTPSQQQEKSADSNQVSNPLDFYI